MLACDSLTDSGRKLPGDIGGGGDGGGARGDVRGGAARAGRRRRQCLRDARGGRSLRAELHCLSAWCFGAAVPASERVPANPRWRGPLLAASAADRWSSRSTAPLFRGLEALSVGPIPARFLLLPIEAPDMSFSISSEMNQVIRAGSRRWRRKRARPGFKQRDGAGGWVDGARRGAASWSRGRTLQATAGAARARLSRRCHGCRVALAAEAGAGRLRGSSGRGSRAGVFAHGILGGLGQGDTRQG